MEKIDEVVLDFTLHKEGKLHKTSVRLMGLKQTKLRKVLGYLAKKQFQGNW